VTIEVALPIEDFDRLCVWGASHDDWEDEMMEDDGDLEEHQIA
jgi:hypothetical protein